MTISKLRVSASRRQILLGAAAGTASGLAPRAVFAQQSCIIGDYVSNNPNNFRTFRLGGPPQSSSTASINNYPSWPVTDVASTSAEATTSTYPGQQATWPINAWFYVWANRMVPPNQTSLAPNPIMSPVITRPDTQYECRVAYSTVALANAATQSIIRYWLGYPSPPANLTSGSLNPYGGPNPAGGSSPYVGLNPGNGSYWSDPWATAYQAAYGSGASAPYALYSTLAASPTTWFPNTFGTNNNHNTNTYNYMTDIIWVPTSSVSTHDPSGLFQRVNMLPGATQYTSAPGVVLDYEVGEGVANGRTTAVTSAFFANLHSDIHSIVNPTPTPKLMVWTDALNGTAVSNSGLDATNLSNVLNNYLDYLSIQLWSQNKENNIAASYYDQIGLLEGGDINGNCSNNVPYNKLFIIYDLANSSANPNSPNWQSDAQFAFNLLTQGKLTQSPNPNVQTAPSIVWFWNDGVYACNSQYATASSNAAMNAVITGVLEGNGSAPTSAGSYPVIC